ncbi:uncharacterized protein [Clytia hemisphaerica]|uniref:Fibrinogen C-terminal domain-containing protein n=1 Tax=Clytia hemisphaerica TaxID=252671 RepID=A0A7M5UPB1_9CNID|eukprot:TCONS_00041336-protein
MYLAVFFTQIILVYPQWYEKDLTNQPKTTSIDTKDDSKPVPARSPIECVLKCKRNLQQGYFIEEKQLCFCFQSKEQELFSDDENENLDGASFQEHREHMQCGSEIKTCKDVKEICPHCKSGIYEMEILGEKTKAFCDLNTDGGGWLQITNIKFDNTNKIDSIYTNHIAQPSSIADLQNVPNSQFMLDPLALQSLFNEEGYSELRIKCYKPWHSRTLDVVLYGEKIHKYVNREASTVGGCDAVRFLPDDNSSISLSPCADYRIGAGVSFFYQFPIWIWARGHVAIAKTNARYECDDIFSENNFDPQQRNLGYWYFYIR